MLASLVADGTYPDSCYGENNHPEVIPESLCRTDWWYRTTFTVPKEFRGRRLWLEFGGINRAAVVDVEIESDADGRVKIEFAQGEKKGTEKHRDPRVCGFEIIPE